MDLEKYFEKQRSLYITKFGKKILEEEPNFVRNIWENKKYREFWFNKGQKIFTKINWNEKLFVEKSGAEGEILKYARMKDFLEEKDYKNIRLAKTYFQKKDKILLEYFKHHYIPQSKNANDIEPNDLAFEELGDLLMTLIPIDFCIEKNGNLIVIDPHI